MALHKTMTKLKMQETQRSLKMINGLDMSFGHETEDGPPQRDDNNALPELHDSGHDSAAEIMNDSILSVDVPQPEHIALTDFANEKDIAERQRFLIDQNHTKKS